jgi:tight adherence protein B
MNRRTTWGLGGLALLLTLGVALSASAQSAVVVGLRQALLSADGTTKLVVSVSGVAGADTLSADNFRVTEAGQPVDQISIERLSQSRAVDVTVMLVMDTSGSTNGKPLDDAKAAARNFVSSLPPNVRVGLIGFGPTAVLRVPFTTNRAQVIDSINTLRAAGGTAFYDAVRLGANTLNTVPRAQHNMLVFSDAAGDDNSSRFTLADAVNSVKSAKAPVISVLLAQTAAPVELNQLANAVKGGRLVQVSQSAQLAAAFQQVAQDITNQYVITYSSGRLEPKDLDLAVTVTVGSAVGSDRSTVINTRTEGASSAAGQPHQYKSRAPISAFATKTGYYVGIGAVFAAALLFLGILFYAPTKGRAAGVLQRGLRLYSRGDRKKEKERAEGFLGGTAVGRRAVEFVEKMPRSEQLEAKLQALLDRAAWPLRATEFIVLQIGGAVVGALFGFGLLARWWLGIVLMVGGAIMPRLVLATRVAKREAQFLSQLPDTLQLLAGSLQAGYGFMQAIDTVAKEASPPASHEFSRVLAEARLGMPVDEALNSMADRVGGEDFRWVVLAINIQRQVGGNLAALLTTVASTLREREMVRRQIKVLSAEGRLSAYILLALPFALAGYISVVNPGYINQLFEETIGKMMVAGGIVLMVIGVFWMRKIIKIDV